MFFHFHLIESESPPRESFSKELSRYCLASPPTSVVGDALHRVRFGEFVSLWVHRASRNRKGRGANERDLADAHLRTGSCGWLFVSAE